MLFVSRYYHMENGLLYSPPSKNVPFHYRARVLVLPSAVVNEVVTAVHEGEACHFGLDKTLALLRQRYYFSHMYSNTKRVIQRCATCLAYNRDFEFHTVPLQTVKVERAFQIVGIDITQVPEDVNETKYILTVIDYLTKWAIAETLSEVTADAVVEVLLS
eukprot:Nk52_evm1s1509 gene=Nk52_evmTU1s1509